MDVSTLITMTQTVLQLLDSSVIQEIGNFCSFRSQLAKMKDTMSTVKAVLLDAEEQENHQIQRSKADDDWLEKLRDVVYEADDLFDKVATIAQRGKLVDDVGGKVCLMFSHPAFIFSASRRIKEIRERLDAIAKDHRDFGSYVMRQQQHPVGVGEGQRSIVRKTREESRSHVRDENVVGRDDDKRALIDILLNPDVEEDVSFITIVGIGGLGKTTHAQLAYNDERIQREFTQRLWVCVSQSFDIYNILLRTLEQLTDNRYDQFGWEKVQNKFLQEIKGKRYLLVLDDIWNENRERWLQLRDLLIEGGRGSRILVTTRSHMVARVIGHGPTYELEGLSLKDAWRLFERMAFEKEEGQADVELVEIGKEIVRRCANIPLAIRIIASLLYGQGKSKWRSFRDIDLIHLKQDGVLPVLKLSYYHLVPPLKNCFNYCALFPTDCRIEKKILIRLWIAQGFIVPSYGQSVEEASEEYFWTLLHRGFFQDVKQDNHGEIISCKIPAILHNLAQEAVKSEISVANTDTSQLNGKLRHLSVYDLPHHDEIPWIANCPIKCLRTLFNQVSIGRKSLVENFISKGRCLRVLNLRYSQLKSLPAINYLLHLRYLDLSGNYLLQALPDSLTKLHNLQTLKLNQCCKLKELPQGLRKLVNLKHLELSGCSRLTHMPPRISCLTSLQTLTMFVLGQTGLFKVVCTNDELNDLRALTNLEGSLIIMIRQISTDMAKVGGARYLVSMEHLTDIVMDWSPNKDKHGNHEALLTGLQPHHNLRKLELVRYPGARFPSWDLLKNSGAPLTKLVKISLYNCAKLEHLPSMCQVPNLKTFELVKLDNLEYIENNVSGSMPPASAACSSLASDKPSFFPSLEILKLKDLPKLKGWWRSSGEQQQLVITSLSFHRLFVLQLHNCPLLTTIPVCKNVEDLELIKFNEALRPFVISNKNFVADPSSSSSSLFNLKRLMIDNAGYLNSWPLEHLQQLCYMEINSAEVQSLSTVAKVFQCRVKSLLSLDILCCSELRSLAGGGLEYLTALETLRFHSLQSISLRAEDVMPWNFLHHSLRSLEFVELPKLVNLPKGMQYLTTLRSLKISQCRNLEAIPEWISGLSSLQNVWISDGRLKTLPKAMQDLTSLRSLTIYSNSEDLQVRCQKPTGEDWPNIQHIPYTDIIHQRIY